MFFIPDIARSVSETVASPRALLPTRSPKETNIQLFVFSESEKQQSNSEETPSLPQLLVPTTYKSDVHGQQQQKTPVVIRIPFWTIAKSDLPFNIDNTPHPTCSKKQQKADRSFFQNNKTTTLSRIREYITLR